MAVQSALNLILHLKSPADLQATSKELDANWDDLTAAADAIGTLHSMRWVAIDDSTVGLFTTYDGDMDTYIQDFLKYLGPMFDQLVTHVDDAPPRPVQKNPREFIEWTKANDLPSLHGVYFAYPDLSVQDIKALAAG
jgi:hypothetical protein